MHCNVAKKTKSNKWEWRPDNAYSTLRKRSDWVRRCKSPSSQTVTNVDSSGKLGNTFTSLTNDTQHRATDSKCRKHRETQKCGKSCRTKQNWSQTQKEVQGATDEDVKMKRTWKYRKLQFLERPHEAGSKSMLKITNFQAEINVFNGFCQGLNFYSKFCWSYIKAYTLSRLWRYNQNHVRTMLRWN